MNAAAEFSAFPIADKISGPDIPDSHTALAAEAASCAAEEAVPALNPAPDTGSADRLEARLRGIRHVALDMDGTVYQGGRVFPFTNDFLARLEEWGIGYTFLTNNSSKSRAEYAAHLEKLGIPAGAERIFISTHATIEYLRQEHPGLRRLFVLGSAGMKAELAEAGFWVTAEPADPTDPTDLPDRTDPSDAAAEEPEAVVVGFDLAMSYRDLCQAAWWIRQGKLFVASHPDNVCPTDQPTVLVDCGSICAALTAATGRGPDAIAGKPHPRMLEGLMQRLRLKPEEMAMAGDRVYTDIEMARRAGALGVLVLSGEATAEDAARAEFPPDLVVADLSVFAERLKAARESEAFFPPAPDFQPPASDC